MLISYINISMFIYFYYIIYLVITNLYENFFVLKYKVSKSKIKGNQKKQKRKYLPGAVIVFAVIVPPSVGFNAAPRLPLRTPCGRVIPPLSDGCVCTRPCVAEKKLLSNVAPGVVICDRHQDSAVDWSDLSDVSE